MNLEQKAQDYLLAHQGDSTVSVMVGFATLLVDRLEKYEAVLAAANEITFTNIGGFIQAIYKLGGEWGHTSDKTDMFYPTALDAYEALQEKQK